jgi:hypothetical protein
MITRRILMIAALGFAAGAALAMPTSADDTKSCSTPAAAACARDESCDPECCALLSEFCCAADATARLADLSETQAAEVKALRAAACEAVAPHAKRAAAARRDMRAGVAKSDGAAVRASAATLAEATADGLLAAGEYTTKLVAALTPDQRAKVEKAVACDRK